MFWDLAAIDRSAEADGDTASGDPSRSWRPARPRQRIVRTRIHVEGHPGSRCCRGRSCLHAQPSEGQRLAVAEPDGSDRRESNCNTWPAS